MLKPPIEPTPKPVEIVPDAPPVVGAARAVFRVPEKDVQSLVSGEWLAVVQQADADGIVPNGYGAGRTGKAKDGRPLCTVFTNASVLAMLPWPRVGEVKPEAQIETARIAEAEVRYEKYLAAAKDGDAKVLAVAEALRAIAEAKGIVP